MGKSTISMAIFKSYVSHNQRVISVRFKRFIAGKKWGDFPGDESVIGMVPQRGVFP